MVRKINIDAVAEREEVVPADSLPADTMVSRPRSGRRIFTIVILVILLGVAWYGYRQGWFGGKSPAQITEQNTQAEADKIVSAVGKHLVLPTDEQPTIYTINDVAQLASQQPFYVGAHDGDALLVYFKAQKAIIYSQTTDRLINVGPIIYDKNATSTSGGAATSSPTKKK